MKSTFLQTEPQLSEIVKRLIDVYQPVSIHLFGSVARGEAGPESDYDSMVVVPDDASPERRREKLAYDCLWGTGTAADILVWTRSRFARKKSVSTSLPATVLREGVLLYDRDGLEYQPVRHDHDEFLKKAMTKEGFAEAYESLEEEYALIRQRITARMRPRLSPEKKVGAICRLSKRLLK